VTGQLQTIKIIVAELFTECTEYKKIKTVSMGHIRVNRRTLVTKALNAVHVELYICIK